MSDEAKKEERLTTIMQDCIFTLSKLTVIKLDKGAEFDPKSVRGTYVVNSVNKIDLKHLKAGISLHLFYGEEAQKKFFDLECDYIVEVTLNQDLEREVGSDNDNIDLLNFSFSYVDKVTSPLVAAMGYTFKIT